MPSAADDVRRAVTRQRQLDEAAARRAVGFTTTRSCRVGASTACARSRDRVGGEAVAELAGLGVAHRDLVDDLVGAARARRVVRAVQRRAAATRGRAARAGTASAGRNSARQRLGALLDRALGRRARPVDVDPVRRDAHEHVGARAGPQLAAPGREPVGRLGRQVLGQRRDDELVLVLDLRSLPRRRGRATAAASGGRCRSSAACRRCARVPSSCS